MKGFDFPKSVSPFKFFSQASYFFQFAVKCLNTFSSLAKKLCYNFWDRRGQVQKIKISFACNNLPVSCSKVTLTEIATFCMIASFTRYSTHVYQHLAYRLTVNICKLDIFPVFLKQGVYHQLFNTPFTKISFNFKSTHHFSSKFSSSYHPLLNQK